MPKICVIVPVYNTEKYLHRCIDSILAQTFTDFELLLIDDGSKDNSGKICDEYAAKDERVRVFHKENGGVSSARNLGLDNAVGEWIAFIDADDYVETDYLYSLVSHTDADLIMSSFVIIDNVEEWNNYIKKALYNSSEIKLFLERYINTATLCAPWCKLFKRSLISNLRFNEAISFAEDAIFCFEYLEKIDSIRTIDYYGYHYRRGINDALSEKLLSVTQYRTINQEYSKSFKKIECRLNYNGTFAIASSNSNQLRKCLSVIRLGNRPLRYRYKDFIELLNDDNIQELLKYKNNHFKGRKRKIFDFLALNRWYVPLFVYVICYRGLIY